MQAFPSLHQDTGEFCVYVGTNPENTEIVIRLIKSEFADIAANGVTQEELDRAKESASGHLVLSTEATRTRMVRMGRAEVTDTEVLSAEDVIERLNAVTMDDVETGGEPRSDRADHTRDRRAVRRGARRGIRQARNR